MLSSSLPRSQELRCSEGCCRRGGSGCAEGKLEAEAETVAETLVEYQVGGTPNSWSAKEVRAAVEYGDKATKLPDVNDDDKLEEKVKIVAAKPVVIEDPAVVKETKICELCKEVNVIVAEVVKEETVTKLGLAKESDVRIALEEVVIIDETVLTTDMEKKLKEEESPNEQRTGGSWL